MLCLPGLLLPEPLSPQQATADPCLRRRPSNIYRQVWLSLLWGVTAPFPESWCAFSVPLAGIMFGLGAVGPLLLSCGGFSFARGHGISFFGGFQHFLVDDCSAAS